MNETVLVTIGMGICLLYAFMRAELNGEKGSDYCADYLAHFLIAGAVFVIIAATAQAWLGK